MYQQRRTCLQNSCLMHMSWSSISCRTKPLDNSDNSICIMPNGLTIIFIHVSLESSLHLALKHRRCYDCYAKRKALSAVQQHSSCFSLGRSNPAISTSLYPLPLHSRSCLNYAYDSTTNTCIQLRYFPIDKGLTQLQSTPSNIASQSYPSLFQYHEDLTHSK